jgi:hypothetical protein
MKDYPTRRRYNLFMLHQKGRMMKIKVILDSHFYI